MAALATALAGSVAGVPAATAAGAGNAPVVTFTTPSVTGFTATLRYSINRDPQQIAKVTCTLTSAAGATGASCGSRTGSSKKSTTYQVTLTNLDAAHWTYTVSASTTDGKKGSAATSFTISPVPAHCTVTGYSVAYDAHAHIATGSCTGIGGSVLPAADLHLAGTSHTGAGNYSDTWSFTDPAGNYTNLGGSVTDTITPATAACVVSEYSLTYDATAHIATGSCTGVDGTVLAAADLHLAGTSHTGAGSYSDTWSFTDPAGNYTNPGGSLTDAITHAAANCTVAGYSLTYDATEHTATGSCTGVDGTTLPAADLDLSGTRHTGAGAHTDAWSFTDPDGNYVSPGGTLTDTIGPATADCTITGYTLTSDSTAHTATGSCTGIGGVDLSSDLDLTDTTHTEIGDYTDTWTFTDPAGNYTNPGGTVSDTINPVDTAQCVVTNPGLDATYPNLSDAVAAASAGDALLVRGTCVGTTTIDRDLTITGEQADGSGTPTLDGGAVDGATGSVLAVASGVTATITGLTITDGNNPSGLGGGIYNQGTLTLHDSNVTGNTASSGGGIENRGALNLTGDSTITGNTATGQLGGSGQGGGGIDNVGAVVNLYDTSSITNNAATGGGSSGGGIFSRAGAVTLNGHSSIADNSAGAGGGIRTGNQSPWVPVTLNDYSSITGNTATGSGGGIQSVSSGLPVVLNGYSTISGNTAPTGGGVALLLSFTSITLNEHSSITGNTASQHGGGIAGPGAVNLNGGTVTGNTPDNCYPIAC